MAYVWKNCPTCGRYAKTDCHHILPQFLFNGEGATINICEDCHQRGVEQIMPPRKIRLTKREYREIFRCFVQIQSIIYKIDQEEVLKLAFG